MKKIYLLAIAVFSNIVLFGQAPNWDWAKSAGATSAEYGQGTATDALGNVYLVGAFQSSTITFGTTTLTNNGVGDFDIFIAKYDPLGNVLWAQSAGGLSFDYGYGITTDASGNVYITGWFQSTTIVFGSTTLTNAGVGTDIFLVKYDPSGNVLWAKSEGGSTGDTGYGVATDANGNVYITGEFQSPTMTIGATILTNAGGTVPNDIFIAKYDNAGTPLWAQRAGGTGSDFGNSIAIDNYGNAYVTGNFSSSTINFGTGPLTNAGVYDLYIAKYDPSGGILWAKRAGGSSGDGSNSVAIDSNGDVCISGIFTSSTIDFGTGPWANAGGNDVFVVKYDNAGNAVWVNTIGGSLNEETYNLATDNLGNVYVAGDFQSASITIGSTTLTNAGNYDVFVAKYNALGNSLWAIGAGGSGYDYGYSICTDTNSNVYVSGYFSSATFTLGTTTLTNAGGSDIFIGKLGSPLSANEITISENSVNAFPNPFNNSIQLNFNLKNNEVLNIELTDLLGKTVYSIPQKEFPKGGNSIEINFSNCELNNGMYLLKIISVNQMVVEKLTRIE